MIYDYRYRPASHILYAVLDRNVGIPVRVIEDIICRCNLKIDIACSVGILTHHSHRFRLSERHKLDRYNQQLHCGLI